MKVFILVACLVAVAVARNAEFETFKARFGKTYKSQFEEKYRLGVFEKNLELIKEHNQKFEQGKTTFTLAVNQFADLTAEEHQKQNNNLIPRASNYVSKNVYVPSGKVGAATVDWRDSDIVTPVKDQGQCGSCWSFSTTGSTEGQHALATGKLVSLSEQNLIDCSWSYGNLGCDGGLMDSAFQYIIDNKGIDTEASYPYEESSEINNCRYTNANNAATISAFTDVRSGSEDDLLSASGTIGPISVAIDASHASFQLYSSGVYSEPLCSSTNLDHGVLVVGYGTDAGTDYWLVKNSWGESWGIKGYIEMSRGKSNQCGIATQASYPKV